MKRHLPAIFAVCIGLAGFLALAHWSACESDGAFCYASNEGSEP